MTSPLARHLKNATAVAAVLGVAQALVGMAALLWVYRGQTLPPFGFFSTQVYDCFAKLGFAVGRAFGWTLPLADHFRGVGWASKLALLPELLLLDVAVALALGAILGLAGALVAPRREGGVGAYLRTFALVGLAVHATALLSTMPFGVDPNWQRVVYSRLPRAFILDGTLLAVLTFGVALLLARVALRALAHGPRVVLRVATAAVALVALLGAVGRGHGAAPKTTATPEAAARPAPGWNVLLISIDSLRADHLGCYGYGRDTSPVIDGVAREGIRFASAVSPTSWTLPSHISLFSGRYGLSHGVVTEMHRLSLEIPTLGEVLQGAGYRTAGFVSGPYLAGHYGYARGMDTYEDLSARYEHRREARSAVVAPTINEMAERWLDQHGRERFFLFLHYFDVHYDYVPPAPFDKMFDPDYRGTVDSKDLLKNPRVNAKMDPRDLAHVKALYDGEIRFTDMHVGKVLAKLEQMGVRDRTLVVITSDHGDEFFEHGSKGHQRTLYDEVLLVPLVVRLPDGADAGRVVREEVSLVDVMPTVLELLGVSAPSGMDGESLIALMQGRGTGAPREVYGEFYNKLGLNVQVARRSAATKVIQHFNRIMHPSRPALEWYDLSREPGETTNRAESGDPALRGALAGMGQALERLWRSHRRLAATEPVAIDAATRARLESLGYLGH
jgi:arylsulfatase A-like enzyme